MTVPLDDSERTKLLVHAYLDGELDPMNAAAIERQITTDPELAAERARVDALRQVLRERLPPMTPPPGLEAKIRKSIGSTQSQNSPSWRAMAASIAVAAVVSSSATWMLARPSPADTVTDAVVAAHLRGLMAAQPTDVASSDRHTVKPWFNGKIPQAPRVVDLSQEGFRLVGGRVDVVGRAAVPTLVYQIREHLVSLTEIPRDIRDTATPTVSTVRGFNLVGWTDSETAYRAVSDLNVAELKKFAQVFRDSPPER